MDVWAKCCIVYNYGDYSHHFSVEVLHPLPHLDGVVLLAALVLCLSLMLFRCESQSWGGATTYKCRCSCSIRAHSHPRGASTLIITSAVFTAFVISSYS